MLKAYIITFNQPALLDPFNYEKFHQYLLNYSFIKDWWHYLKCTYIVITPAGVNASNLTEYLQQYLKQINFLVIEVKLENHNGLLHPDAWKWINNQIAKSRISPYKDLLG